MSMPLTLSDEVIQFMESGVSITAGSRDFRHVPSMARALACRVAEDGSQVDLWLVRSHSEQLRLDCRVSGHVAAVFSQPTTHRTLQVKGDYIGEAQDDGSAPGLVDEHRSRFGDELAQIGFSRNFTDAMVNTCGEPLVVVRFAALELYDQTPGPDAGRKLAGPE